MNDLTDFFALMIPAMVPFLLAAQGTVHQWPSRPLQRLRRRA